MIRSIRQRTTSGRGRRTLFSGMSSFHSAKRSTNVEALEPKNLLAADPIISEFQAVNNSTLTDEDGDFSDWIEVRNLDLEPMDIGGWYLTDDASDLRKWQFPQNTMVGASDEILVYASGKNRVNGPQNQLHTNFGLNGNGEFLALVKPDGVTISQSYNPYPEQLEDQSYGMAADRDIYTLIQGDAPVSAFVPTDDSLGDAWTNADFDDSAWQSGTTAVGYEVLAPGFSVLNPFDAPLGPEWTIDMPAGSTSTVTLEGGALSISVPEGSDLSNVDRGTAPIIHRSLPNSTVADYELVTHITQTPEDEGAVGLVVLNGDTGLPAIQFEYNDRTLMRLIANGDELDTDRERNRDAYFMRLVRNSVDRSWEASFKLEEANDWTELDVIFDGVDGVPSTISNPRVGLYARGTATPMNVVVDFFDINVPDQVPVYGPRLGLDVGASMLNNNSSVYMRFPFTLDIDPAQLDELSMSASFDDGFRAFINGVEVTTNPGEPLQENFPIAGDWQSAATREFGANSGSIPVRTFNLATSIGALQEGANVLAIQGANVAADDSDFFFTGELTAANVLESSPQPFVTPTPGESNDMPAAPTPIITGQEGLFFGSTEVTVTMPVDIPTLSIHYTIDGSDPTVESPEYTGPLTLNTSAMLQVVAIDTSPVPTFVPSNAASATLIAIDATMQGTTSNLPLLVLDGFGTLAGASGNSLTPMNAVMMDVSKATGVSAFDGSPANIEYIGRAGARDRGSSTSGQNPPNMAFETWGTAGTTKDDDSDVSWLGLSPEADWVLHKPFSFDRALMRNQVAFELSNRMDMWATDWRNIEVYIDGGGRREGDGVIDEDDYVGVYALLEKIEQGNGRLDLADTDAASVVACTDATPDCTETGSFVLKVDRADPDAGTFTAGTQALNWVYPKSPDSRTARDDQKATDQQEAQIQAYFGEFRDTLDNPDINDPNGYSKYIDPVAWVDHQMHNVYMMNVDALRLSAYLHKDAGERVKFGPVWDFDRSAESNDDRDDDPFVWRSENGDLGTDFFGNGTQRFWGDLFSDPGFWQLYVDRWQMWRDTVLSDASVNELIDSIAAEIGPAAIRNHEEISGSRPRTTSGYDGNVLDGTYQGEVENLKKWLSERGRFMDENFAQRPELTGATPDGAPLLPNATGAVVSSGTVVQLSPPALPFNIDEILIDGSSGAPAKYIGIGDDALGETWTANDFDDAAWNNGPLGIGFASDDDFDGLIQTEYSPAAEFEGSTTTLIRVDFNIDDVDAARTRNLILRMKYDDGFVAYVNGVRVHEQNVRDEELAWDSRGRSHRDADAVIFEDFDVSSFAEHLVQGKNTLAIRSINSSGTNNDMLILPELVLREVQFGVNPDARVYYTTDGTDPRGPDGQPTASAQMIQGGGPLTITDNTRIVARNFDDSFRGVESNIVLTDWSGPVQYDLVVSDGTTLAISEINYNPSPETPAERLAGFDSDDFEYIELHNFGSTPVNLDGIQLADGVEADLFGAGSISAGGYGVVVANTAAFQSRYPGVQVLGEYTGNLNNNGEDIDVRNGAGTVVFSVNYGDADPWPAAADGLGATLVLNDVQAGSASQGKWYSWSSSTENGGTPGASNGDQVGIVINEVLARTDAPIVLTDSIELHNTTGAAVDISGWFLSDSPNNLFAYQIPNGSSIPAGGYLVLNESNFNAANDPEGFGLNGTGGDSVYLVQGTKSPTAQFGGQVTTFVDDVHFRETLNGETLGRVPNGTGRLAPLDRSTLGSTNVNPRVGPLLITEVSYNPIPNSAALAADPSLEASDLEFIEIHNPTGAAVAMSGWRLRGGGDYEFTDGVVLSPGGYIVVLKFNPDNPENINQVNAFRAHYGIGANVTLVGGYNGLLNNSDDQVLLLRPDVSAGAGNPHVQEDEVLYDDLAPWPLAADGLGSTLQRVSTTAFGNDAASWAAAPGSPGGAMGDPVDIPGDSNRDGIFNSSDLVFVFTAGEYEDAIAGNSTFEEGDWDGDGDFTTSDLVFAFTNGAYSAAARPVALDGQAIAAATDDAFLEDDVLDLIAASHKQSDESQEWHG